VLGFCRRRLAGDEAKGIGKSGAVVVVQRCSSDLKLNPHFHALFLDGVYRSAARITACIALPEPFAQQSSRWGTASGGASTALTIFTSNQIVAATDEGSSL
jgi:hypothetical protein